MIPFHFRVQWRDRATVCGCLAIFATLKERDAIGETVLLMWVYPGRRTALIQRRRRRFDVGSTLCAYWDICRLHVHHIMIFMLGS